MTTAERITVCLGIIAVIVLVVLLARALTSAASDDLDALIKVVMSDRDRQPGVGLGTRLYADTADDALGRQIRDTNAEYNAARFARAAFRRVDLVPAWCDGIMTCQSHDPDRCAAQRSCCSTCPVRRDQ